MKQDGRETGSDDHKRRNGSSGASRTSRDGSSGSGGRDGQRSPRGRTRPRVRRLRGLYWKYVFIFVVLVGSTLLVSGVVQAAYAIQETAVALLDLQQEKVSAVAAQIGHFVNDIEEQVQWTARSQPQSGQAAQERRRADYRRLLDQIPAITSISYVDASGRETIYTSRFDLDGPSRALDRSQEPAVRQALTGDTYYGKAESDSNGGIHMLLAISENQPGAGAIITDISLRQVGELVKEITVGRTGYAYVVDGDGRLIAHPQIDTQHQDGRPVLPQVKAILDARDVGVNPPDELAASEQPLPPINSWHGVLNYLFQPWATIDLARFALNDQDIPVLVANRLVDPPGWLVMVEQPAQETLPPLVRNAARTAALLVAGVGAALLVSLLFAGGMVRPIRLLQNGAIRIGEGILDQRINIRTGDELESLADAFNEMAGHLREYYATMEQRVELERAREIQARLLPQSLPGWPGQLELAFRFRPAREMSGDFYDVLPLVPAGEDPGPTPPLQIAAGDVMGKGIGAALVMSLAQSTIRAVAEPVMSAATVQSLATAPAPAPVTIARATPSPATTLRLAGSLLHRGVGRQDFVACALAVIEPVTSASASAQITSGAKGAASPGMAPGAGIPGKVGQTVARLHLANAAQVPPLLCRRGVATELNPPGDRLPLGILPQPQYEELALDLEPGDVVIFASDGLPEAPAFTRRGKGSGTWPRGGDGRTASGGTDRPDTRANVAETWGKTPNGTPTNAPTGTATRPGTPPLATSMGTAYRPPAAWGELFGFERLAASAAHWAARTTDAEGVAAGLWTDLTAWCGEASQHDDMTLVVLRVTGPRR